MGEGESFDESFFFLKKSCNKKPKVAEFWDMKRKVKVRKSEKKNKKESTKVGLQTRSQKKIES